MAFYDEGDYFEPSDIVIKVTNRLVAFKIK